MRKTRLVAAVLLAMLCVSALGAETFSVGAASVVITPPQGTMLAGYGRDRPSEGVYDDLYAHAVVIGDGDSVLALVTLDCIGLTRPDIVLIQRAVAETVPDIDPRAVVVSSTHTHAGPDVVGLWGEVLWRSGRDEAYVASLRAAAVQAVRVAFDVSVPVTSFAASAEVALEWVENLSEPGLLDSTLSVLRFVGDDGRTVATLTNYPCHPTVLDGNNTHVSADYVAGFYRAMSERYDGEHLFLQGAIGGWVQPLQGDRSTQLAYSLGRDLAGRAVKLLERATPNVFQPLVLRQRVFDVPLENWAFRLAIWLGVLERETHDGAMRTETAWFRVGDAQFVTHPGETSPAYSLASRALMKARYEFVLGLTQDAMGYILKPDYFEDDASYPHGDYLRSVSVGAAAGPVLMETLEAIVDDLEPSER
ncbi:MAG: hypothetical protein QF921_14705 [Pseudomonadales bacterium]|jgi:hypothetical protein|nr:hypothetical protein [Pseudomonadales bacterium]MDP6469691.1 hypothetical protein [Pseudomonadales bacterium]MDP6828932.1 hypothetical protein [Pseudomonadales bacterium]MDP6972732.1 hypothetical protein [Pseudomonadales bacterium]